MNLDNLFKWSGEVHIVNQRGEPVLDGGKPLVLYQRVVGDADLSEARTHALMCSRVLRKALRDIGSQEYNALIPDTSTLDRETKVDNILNLRFLVYRDEAIRNLIPPRKPVEPEVGSPLEMYEEYSAAEKEYSNKVDAEVRKSITEIVARERQKLSERSEQEIDKDFEAEVVDALCRAEMVNEFNRYSAYLGTFNDKKFKARAFASYEEFSNASSALIKQILEAYLSIEVDSETLKN